MSDATMSDTSTNGTAAGSTPLLRAVARPKPPSAFSNALVFGWRAVLKFRHVPEQLFDLVMTPIMFTLLFTFVFGGALAGSPGDYLQVFIPGILVQTVVFNAVYSGMGLSTDLGKGLFDRFRSLPIWPLAPFAGLMVGDILRHLIAGGIILAIGLALGYRPEAGVVGVVAAFLLLLVIGFGVGWIFLVLGLLLKTPTAVMTIGFAFLFPINFASKHHGRPRDDARLAAGLRRRQPGDVHDDGDARPDGRHRDGERGGVGARRPCASDARAGAGDALALPAGGERPTGRRSPPRGGRAPPGGQTATASTLPSRLIRKVSTVRSGWRSCTWPAKAASVAAWTSLSPSGCRDGVRAEGELVGPAVAVIDDDHLLDVVQLDRHVEVLPEGVVPVREGVADDAERRAGEDDVVIIVLEAPGVHERHEVVDEAIVHAAQEQRLRVAAGARLRGDAHEQRRTGAEGGDLDEVPSADLGAGGEELGTALGLAHGRKPLDDAHRAAGVGRGAIFIGQGCAGLSFPGHTTPDRGWGNGSAAEAVVRRAPTLSRPFSSLSVVIPGLLFAPRTHPSTFSLLSVVIPASLSVVIPGLVPGTHPPRRAPRPKGSAFLAAALHGFPAQVFSPGTCLTGVRGDS